ncbi:MAG TPA: DNA primase [Candidatus Syntrophosphaera thermopropionivorans]|nr:DNA primase [Candidatus Syntrophosphaera thermopropionivorans]
MDKNLIEEIRRSNDIVDVVQEYVPLKKVGTNWRGICPFHNDTHPSLYVSQPKQIFKCFACGKAGNVFTFVQEYEKMSFYEAVKKLAQRAGIVIPEKERISPASTKRAQLLRIYTETRDFFTNQLMKQKEVLSYLQNRAISPETAKILELGYAPEGEKVLLNYLLDKGYSVDLLKDSGLFGNYSGNLVDFFRNRLMFPIHNSIGEVVAFGGRILEENENVGKYVNTPGTELYTKGKELYGFFKTKYEISKIGYALICEGYFDFLRLYENGFQNAVASLGTSLTEDQIYLLARYTNKVYMLYDGDAAGIKSAQRAALLCLSKGLDASIIELPEKDDPDSFLLENGPEALQERIAAAKDVIHFMAEAKSKTPLMERIDQLLDTVRSIKDPIKRELIVKDISEAFNVSTRSLFSKLHRTSVVETEGLYSTPALEEYPEERQLLILALKDPDNFNLLAQDLSPDYFNNKRYKELFKYLVNNASANMISEPAQLLDLMENQELRGLVGDFLFEEMQDLDFMSVLEQVKIRKIQRDLRDIDRRIMAEPENKTLLKEKSKLVALYRQMTSKVVHKDLT